MSTERQDFFRFAVENARREFGPWRQPRGQTHWSYYDAPQWALCGERIEPKQFNRDPTCPACQAALKQMQDEDIR